MATPVDTLDAALDDITAAVHELDKAHKATLKLILEDTLKNEQACRGKRSGIFQAVVSGGLSSHDGLCKLYTLDRVHATTKMTSICSTAKKIGIESELVETVKSELDVFNS